MVEHVTFNHVVEGSIPSPLTSKIAGIDAISLALAPANGPLQHSIEVLGDGRTNLLQACDAANVSSSTRASLSRFGGRLKGRINRPACLRRPSQLA